MAGFLNNHLMRDDVHTNHYFEEACPSQPPSLTDHWLFPAALACGLVCSVILVVDLTLRAHALRKSSAAHGRRRHASALGDYSIDDFECLDTGTTNMLLHLQTECNDISAKIDRCAMALVSGSRCSSPDPAGRNHRVTEPEELALTQTELYEQWDNLSWFQQFVSLHMDNAFRYQQYHRQLEEVGNTLDTDLGRLSELLLHAGPTTPANGLEELGSVLRRLVASTGCLDRLLPLSSRLVPLHRRVKFSGRQEALPVRALCDYRKDEFSTRLGEEVLLIWRKNKYTWRVRNTQGVEGDLPALCCLIPGPDPDTMAHAQCLADDLGEQWRAYAGRCEKRLALNVCTVLCGSSVQDSPLVMVTDTNREQARKTLSLVERVMTSDTFHHVISAQDRKSSQGVLHQLYELLNGRSAREETATFLAGLERCHTIIQSFQKQVDLMDCLAKKAQTLHEDVAEARGRKKSLTRQTSFQDTSGTTLSKVFLNSNRRSEQQGHDVTDDVIAALVSASTLNEAATQSSIDAVGKTSLPETKRSYTERTEDPSYASEPPQRNKMDDGHPIGSRNWVERGESAENEGQWFSAASTPTHRPMIHSLSESVSLPSDKQTELTPRTLLEQPESKYSAFYLPPDVREDFLQDGLRKRSTVVVANASNGPGRPKTLNIAPHTASVSTSPHFVGPSMLVNLPDQKTSSTRVSVTKTDDEKLRGEMIRGSSQSRAVPSHKAFSHLQTEKASYSTKQGDLKLSRRLDDSDAGGYCRIADEIGLSLKSVDEPRITNTQYDIEAYDKAMSPRKVQQSKKLPGKQSAQVDKDGSQHDQSVLSNASTTAQTQLSPECPIFTSSPHSLSSSFSQDVSLSLSISSDDELEYQVQAARRPVKVSTDLIDVSPTTDVVAMSDPTGNSVRSCTTSNPGVPTVTILWKEEQHGTALSSFVAFQKDVKQIFSVRSIKDSLTGTEVPVSEAIQSGIIDLHHGLYIEDPTTNGSRITLLEAIVSGRVLLKASVNSSELESQMTSSQSQLMARSMDVPMNETSCSTSTAGSCTEPSLSSGLLSKGHHQLELAEDEEVISNSVDIPVSLMKIIMKRTSQPYLIRQVVDPRTKLIVSVQSAITDGILIQGSAHYRNPNTGEQLSFDDAFARGFLIVDYQKECSPSNDVSLVYRARECVVLTKLIAVCWVKIPSHGLKVDLHEALRRNIIDATSGEYRCDGHEMSLAEAVLHGFIKATVLDNSDLEILIRKIGSKIDVEVV